jgi:hypothetical protein
MTHRFLSLLRRIPLVLREAVRVSAAPEVMDLSELDDSALDQMLGGVEGSAIETIAAPSASSEATPSEELVSVEFELDALTPSPQESEPSRPETIITTAQEIIPQVQQFEGLGPDVVLMVTPMEVFDSRTGILTPYPAEHSAEHTDALPGNHIPDESFLPPLPTELVSVASPVEMLPSPFSSFEAAHIDPAIAALFGEAEIEVPDLTSAIEVSLDQLGTYTDSEDMKLLFDMAEEALLDPTIEKLFERSIIPSEQRHVQASSLLKQLKETEKQLTAPFLSLKNLARRKSKTSATATDSTAPETSAKTPRAHVIPAGSALMTPGAFGYLGGFAIDMTLMVILALVVAINIDLSKDGATGTTLLLGEIPTTLDLILFASRTLIVFLGVAIAYPLLTTLLAKSTPGALVGRYYFIREDGRPIRFGECLIRALLYPLSLIGVGPLAYILLRRPLHDYLAGVILIRREAP